MLVASHNMHRSSYVACTWASERGGKTPRILILLTKKVVFSISRGKNQISTTFDPTLEKIFGKSPTGLPPGKNSSDAHVHVVVNM